MDDRTFCRIARAPFHALVVPRKHIASLAETEDESLLGHLVRVAAKLAKDAGFGERGFRLQRNTGPEGGQDVLHLHWHVYAGRQLPPLPRV